MSLGEFLTYVFLFALLYTQVIFLIFSFEFDPFSKTNKKSNKKLPKPNLSLSVIVACWNEQETIEDTLNSIFASDFPKRKLKVIVVDDGSTDKTWLKLQNYKKRNPALSLLTLRKENGGKHTAVNLALEHVDTDLFATIDADTKLKKDSLKKAVIEFEKDKELAALGGVVLVKDPKTFIQKIQSIEYQMFVFTKYILGEMSGALVVPGAFSVYRTSVMKKIGKFKKAHLLEDLEYTFRMHKHKMKVRQSLDAISYTTTPATVGALVKQRVRWGYGLLKNLVDYKEFIFNRKYSHFGVFTVPMTLLAYFSIPISTVILFFSLYDNFYRLFLKFKVLGVQALGGIHFGLPEININSFLLIMLFVYLLVILFIINGQRIAQEKTYFSRVFGFFVTYMFLTPVWVFKVLYAVAVSRDVKWR